MKAQLFSLFRFPSKLVLLALLLLPNLALSGEFDDCASILQQAASKDVMDYRHTDHFMQQMLRRFSGTSVGKSYPSGMNIGEELPDASANQIFLALQIFGTHIQGMGKLAHGHPERAARRLVRFVRLLHEEAYLVRVWRSRHPAPLTEAQSQFMEDHHKSIIMAVDTFFGTLPANFISAHLVEEILTTASDQIFNHLRPLDLPLQLLEVVLYYPAAKALQLKPGERYYLQRLLLNARTMTAAKNLESEEYWSKLRRETEDRLKAFGGNTAEDVLRCVSSNIAMVLAQVPRGQLSPLVLQFLEDQVNLVPPAANISANGLDALFTLRSLSYQQHLLDLERADPRLFNRVQFVMDPWSGFGVGPNHGRISGF